ncbi:MAG: hypothetical protein DRP78_01215 [Candidatus Omnitrophota bacterium]|nr:MAG: hypothetical protein DRP78_01215 [Candidatus Omnitrophota bacterium]
MSALKNVCISKLDKKQLKNEPDSQYISQLSNAFMAFTKGAENMQQMYEKLQERVDYLTGELEKKDKELEEANRLASLGELAAGVAHEIRNPLCGIELSASLLQRQLNSFAKDKDKAELTANIIEGVRRLDNIVVNLLTFTREKKIVYSVFDPEQLLDEAIAAIEVKIVKNKVTINKKKDCAICVLNADKEQIRQVFINLILNAVEAMPDKGNLEISLSKKNDRLLVISFQDTGYGITQDVLGKIFNPFFTTKDHGTGLGLSISYRIIENHKGKLSVKSVRGKGTTFSVSLPVNIG